MKKDKTESIVVTKQTFNNNEPTTKKMWDVAPAKRSCEGSEEGGPMDMGNAGFGKIERNAMR